MTVRIESIEVARARRKRRPSRDDDDRQTVRMGVDLHRVVDDAARVLASDATVYQRDGELVRVIHTPDDEADALTLSGAPQIRRLAVPTLREMLTRAACWERYDGRSEDYKPCMPSEAVVGALAARGEWGGIRPIVGVIECPTMRPDGSIVDAPGYDGATGYVYEPDEAMRAVRVPAAPSRDDAVRALAELAEPFEEMPWRSPADLHVAVAALLTLVARPAIRGAVPGIAIDASTPGSGKSLATHVVATIATGRSAAMAHWPPDDEELAKVLGAYALRGAALVALDNVATPLGGSSLDRCLTAVDTVELRVLGRSEVPTVRWRAVVLATGNGLEVVGDTVRRVLVARMEPADERPEERSGYRHPDLLGYVRAERPRLVRAALTVLRAYVAAGRPVVGLRPWGSYEAWSALVPAAIAWAGGPDVMACRLDAGDDTTRSALGALLGEWQRFGGAVGCTARDAITRLYPRERLRGEAPPDEWGELRDAIEAVAPTRAGQPPSSRTLGERLHRARGRVVAGLRIDSAGRTRTGVVRWRVVEVHGLHGAHGRSQSFARDLAEIDRGIGGPNEPAEPAHHAEHEAEQAWRGEA